MFLQKVLWLAAALLFAALAAIFLLSSDGKSNDDAPVAEIPANAALQQKAPGPARQFECEGNATMQCMQEGCGGTAYCIGGEWGACVRNMPVCSPRSHIPCFLNACSIGERECNACGDGWNDCQTRSV